MIETDDDPGALREDAQRLTAQSLYLQMRADIVSGDWRQRHTTIDEYVAAVRGPLVFRFDNPVDRRAEVAELSAAGVKVAEQAALMGVSDDTVIRDRQTAKAVKRKPKEQVAEHDETAPAVWPADDIDAPPPIVDLPEPAPEQRAAVTRAARKALDAELKASEAAAELDKITHEWSLASARLTQASAAVRAALKADPTGDLTRAALTRRRSNDVADTHADLLRALLDELTELAGITTDRITTAPSLRRVK